MQCKGADEDVVVYDFIARSWASSRFSQEVATAGRCMCRALENGGNWVASVTAGRWAMYWDTNESSFIDSVAVPLTTWRQPNEVSFASIMIVLDSGSEAALKFVIEEMAASREPPFARGCTSIPHLRRSLPNLVATCDDFLA